MASNGITHEVTVISKICEGACEVFFSLARQKREVNKIHAPKAKRPKSHDSLITPISTTIKELAIA